jgi:zinc protease
MNKSLLLALALLPTLATAAAEPLPEVEIAYEKHILPNGLTLILHEDRKAPVVAVAAWYHVGSKDEKPGRTGFAHLFEHLLFEGSENHPRHWDKELDNLGATDTNGTTWLDRTNYFETVPSTALDYALFMESERMGHFAGFLTQERLDVQRGVVQNEKRQGENEPYGKVWEWLQRASFPEGHPYRWETIGSMEDLNAATLADVKEFFTRHYGAANAVLVLAGDIDPKDAKARVERYFGHIPSGPPPARRKEWVAARSESTRDHMYDRVAQTRIHQVWNLPPDGSRDTVLLSLAAQVLGGSAASRLDAELVHERRVADRVSAGVQGFELASLFMITADVKPEADTAAVESMLHAARERLLRDGPTRAELERARTAIVSGFVRSVEKLGGFSGKAAVLAACETYHDDPACWRRELEIVKSASARDVREAARRWLTRGDHTLVVDPFPDYQTRPDPTDRKKGAPVVKEFPDLAFPALQRDRLSNGIPIVLAERHDVPLVHVKLLFDAGYAADQGRKAGTASMTLGMLNEGTRRYSALELKAAIEALGARLSAGAGLDSAEISLSALGSRLPASLDLLAEVALRPAFDEKEFSRVQAQTLSAIAQEKTDPAALALRILPPLLFGDGHAYAIPFTGSGTESSVRNLRPDDLRAFHRDWLHPGNVTVLVSGDTTLAAIKPLLEARFGGWKAPAAPATKQVGPAALPERACVFLIDKPNAEQSVILAGLLAPPSNDPRHLEIATMNDVLGGQFTARINQNLREDKHWSYGAYSSLPSALGPRPYLFRAPVQTDRTVEAIGEIVREMREFTGKRPATAAEIERMRNLRVRALPGRFETGAAVMGALTAIVQNGWPDDYVLTLKSRLMAQPDDDIRAIGRELVRPERATWVIVGDLAKIEAGVRALKLGEVRVLDADGRPLR